MNPLEYDGWDDMVVAHPGGSFFHTTAWARVLKEAYGFRPVYFAVIENGTLRALLPVMEVNGFPWGRKRGVSLPFSDYSDPFAANEEQYRWLVGHAVEHGRRAGWRTVEIRGGANPWNEESPSYEFLGHTLGLARTEQEIHASFRTNMKRNIARSLREGVQVERSNSSTAMEEYYRLHCLTRKGHGIPPQPIKFFRRIWENVIQRNKGFIVLSTYRKRSVAGAVYFHHRKKAIYKYGASSREGKDSRANNLVMWEAIRWYRANGYEEFCFGRTEPENAGLKEYKNGYGTKEYALPYYKYEIAKNRVIPSHADNGRKRLQAYYTQVPISISRIIGSVLYRHMG